MLDLSPLPTMKQTKEQLLAENAKLQEQLDVWRSNDKTRRDTFAELLGQYTETSMYGGQVKRTVEDINWYRIAFLIGELKADADYSCSIAARDQLKRENNELLNEIYKLRNPEAK